MIDTLMALWNQDRRKRGMQVILTFFLMCISISLLFVITTQSAESQHQNRALTGASPTVPTFGNTVVPNLTPTISVVVGVQTTPAPTPQSPCAATPNGATSHTSTLLTNALVGQTPTPTPHSVQMKHNDGGGGVPVATPPPLPPTPAPATSITPTPAVHAGAGWVSNCTTSNSIGFVTGSSVVTTLAHNIWLILGSSLLGTVLFYGTLFLLKRRRRVSV